MSIPPGSQLKLLLKRTVSRFNETLRVRPAVESVRSLLYHSITLEASHDAQQMTTPVSLFEEQMTYLAENGYQVKQPVDVL